MWSYSPDPENFGQSLTGGSNWLISLASALRIAGVLALGFLSAPLEDESLGGGG